MTICGKDSAVKPRFANTARGFVIFAYGLFTIASQTLIFREFLTSFESNDISVGIFFGCWFFWIAVGAILINNSRRLAEFLTSNIEMLLLAYLPAFVIEVMLIIHIRGIAGIAPYTLLPIPTALFLGVLVNAPVSLITGLLFPVTCRWVKLDTGPAISRVYLLESSGSFIGGLGTTVLLAFGISPTKIFFIIALILSLAVFFSLFSKYRIQNKVTQAVGVLPVILLGFALLFGADKPLSNRLRAEKWSRLLPRESLRGSFRTAQAEYLFGVYQNQWVVMREGSVVEALPDTTAAGRIVALTAAQNPHATRILVIGSGPGLCGRFLRLPQIERVVWAHPDKEYVSRVLEFTPREMTISDSRFEPFTGDVRDLFGRHTNQFDLIVINMPALTSSVTNRYYTLEFYRQARGSLNSGGVLALCVPAGENIMGTELVSIGASVKLTLAEVFPNLVLAPGDYMWFIASEAGEITGNPGILRDRFASIKGAAEVYPPNGLLSIYLPDRAAKAIDAYNSADLPAQHLLNRDSRPLANLYGLLLSARQSDAPVTVLFKRLVLAGWSVFLVPILVYVILRLILVFGKTAGSRASTFDFTFLMFSAGAVGIGVVIILMFFYQTRFGSLYLHIGAVSSLYMAGLAGGSLAANRLLKIKSRNENYPELLLTAVILIHCAILAGIAFWPFESWSHTVFATAFIICGLCAGCYFPITGGLLANRGFDTRRASARLEYADHFGAAAGGILASLVLVPVLGTQSALLILILFALANLAGSALRMYRPARVIALPAFASTGYWLFGIALTLVVCSNLLAGAGRRLIPALPQYAAKALAGQFRIESAVKTLPDTGKTINYFKAFDANDNFAGYIFASRNLAAQIRGFGGKIELAVFTDIDGNLIDFQILRSNETPSYLDMLNNWFASLKGRNIFSEKPFANIDAVTGATVSSKAILETLSESGRKFAGQTGRQATAAYWLPDSQGIYLLVALVLTVIVIYRGGFWSRLFVLAFNVILGGFVFNAQFSTEQIASLLSFVTPAVSLSGVCLLTIGVPLLATLFGNIYCGYMCPFGALQELAGYVLPVRFRPALSKEIMRKARFIKYIILFVLVAGFFLSRNHDTLAIDPLIKVFGFSHSGGFLLLITVIVTGSIFYSRFWCRYLCPAGAFLSLFNKIAIFGRYLPPKHYGNCEYGLTYNDKLDCIYCDKCRFEREPAIAEPTRSRYFFPAVLVIAVVLSAVSIRNCVRALPGSSRITAAGTSAGQIRNVDVQKVRKMIQEGKLSDREADFYKKAE
ncbi:MAG: 4Fe-4S binding protein [Sedimentisphaerales bacterium]|nr:4Fe-4S binding protein [Sedimentisphaerales bacterium]